MPWVMAAMAAAQMLQAEANADSKRKVDSAGIRYAPFTGMSQLPFTPDKTMDIAQQGATGIYGQMQNQKKSDLGDKLTQAQIDRLNSLSGKGGAPMNQGQGPVRGYENPAQANQHWMDLMNKQGGGADQYMQQNPWSMGRY